MIAAKWLQQNETEVALHIIKEIIEDIPLDLLDNHILWAVIWDGEKIVGAGGLCFKEHKGEIKALAIQENARGKYYGDLLLRLLIRKVFDSGGTEVFVKTQKEKAAFFERLQFSCENEIAKDTLLLVCYQDVGGCCC